jgi:hypothetical protein
MSVPGIQLDSAPYFTYFQPNVRQYLQEIKETVMSGKLPEAQQALARLKSIVPSTAELGSGQTTDLAHQMSLGLQAVGNALDAGQLPAARQAIEELGQSFQAMSDLRVGQTPIASPEPALPASTDISVGNSDSSNAGPILNVVV